MSWQITGLRAWITQRLSAVVLLGLGLYLIAVWAWIHPETYAAWHAMVGAPVPGGAALLIFGALLLHCWVGVRDVILDYVRSKSLRLVLLAALALWLSGLGVWGGLVILGAML